MLINNKIKTFKSNINNNKSIYSRICQYDRQFYCI